MFIESIFETVYTRGHDNFLGQVIPEFGGSYCERIFP